jgi:hypothetical protein
MADGLLERLFWRVDDHLDYLLTLASLRILDAVCGPALSTPLFLAAGYYGLNILRDRENPNTVRMEFLAHNWPRRRAQKSD